MGFFGNWARTSGRAFSSLTQIFEFVVMTPPRKSRYFAVSWVASAAGFRPYAFSQEMTGFRSTPIFSISHSITSPGFRYQAFGSPENAATPDTVPVETTSPALYPIGE